MASARIGVAVVVLGTGAVVRANVASGPADTPADGVTATSVMADQDEAAGVATTTVASAEPDAEPVTDDDAAAAPTTVLVAAPVPPVEAPTAETAAPSHVRSVRAVWIEDRDDVLFLRAPVADVCSAEVKTEENANLIYVYVFEHPTTGATCTAAERSVLTAPLDASLGERIVIDAVTGEQFVVGLGDPGGNAG